jgi:hypothetical protein
VEVGQRVQARVLDVAKADGIVDLTLRTHLLQVKEPEPSSAKKEKNKLKVVHCHSSSGMAALACSRFIRGLSCAVVFCLNYLVNLGVQKVYLLSCYSSIFLALVFLIVLFGLLFFGNGHKCKQREL